MGMPALAHDWTAEMVRALPEDGNRYEVVDGELFVTPAPVLPHQLAIGELYQLIAAYLRKHRLGDVIFAPSDIEFDARTLVEPDLFVVPELKAPVPRYFEDPSQLLLAIEVLSPHPRARIETSSRACISGPEYPSTGSWILTRVLRNAGAGR